MYFMQNRMSAKAITWQGGLCLGRGTGSFGPGSPTAPRVTLAPRYLVKWKKLNFLLFSGLVFNCSCLSDRTVVWDVDKS